MPSGLADTGAPELLWAVIVGLPCIVTALGIFAWAAYNRKRNHT